MPRITSQPVPLSENDRGQLRIARSRVTLDSVVAAFERGETPEEIVQNFPTLELEDVYAVVAYCLRNRNDVESYLETQRSESDSLQVEVQAAFPTKHLRDRVLKARGANEA